MDTSTMTTPTLQTVAEIQKSLQNFGAIDYTVFILMLVLCALIGVYFATCGKNKNATSDEDEYLMGGRNMSTFPVAFSLIASWVSGISLLGIPTEIYVFGIEYVYIYLGVVVMGLVGVKVFLPVFHDLQLSSTYEYLERRFDRRMRIFGSVLFTLSLVFWLPIVVYVPALAFNQVTGVNIHIITPCVCLVCVFYTCIGGLKAVVWTDVVQTWMMSGAVLLVLIKGTLDIGGFGVVMQRAWDSDRIEFTSLNPDPTLRYSLLTVVVGAGIHWLQASILNQNMIQRYLALPTMSAVRSALWSFIIGVFFITLICGYAGLVAYATYYECDPLTTKLAKAKDQILPLLVMQVLNGIPGMPGLFTAGVFSAALSSLSTGLNSMSAVMLEDFCKPFYGKISNKKKNWIMKGVVVVFGVICVVLVFVVERLGQVLQLSSSMGSTTHGASLGMFVCGILLPWVNNKGVFAGGIAGLIGGSIVIFGAQAELASGRIQYDVKPVSTENCNYIYDIVNNTQSVTEMMTDGDSYVFPLYKISYYWYTAFGMFVTVIVAVIVSYFTGFNDLRDVDPACVSPVIRHKFLPDTKQVKQEELIRMICKDQMIKENENNHSDS